jgi:hypothetical protein
MSKPLAKESLWYGVMQQELSKVGASCILQLCSRLILTLKIRDQNWSDFVHKGYVNLNQNEN